MSLPSTPDIKIKEEEPVEVDSSPPDSPASRPRSPQHKDKVGLSPRADTVPLPCGAELWGQGLSWAPWGLSWALLLCSDDHSPCSVLSWCSQPLLCVLLVLTAPLAVFSWCSQPLCVCALQELPSKPPVLSTPTPTIVRPGSLPLHLGYDPLHPTLPSPTSVITQAPPSNRQLG